MYAKIKKQAREFADPSGSRAKVQWVDCYDCEVTPNILHELDNCRRRSPHRYSTLWGKSNNEDVGWRPALQMVKDLQEAGFEARIIEPTKIEYR
jgi:hypothetical protein